MTAFVTGGTGFIGWHIARALAESGQRVRCLMRASSDVRRLAELGVDRVIGDLTDLGSLRRAMVGADVVYHCAADYRLYARDRRQLYRSNVDGTRHVLIAAAEQRV